MANKTGLLIDNKIENPGPLGKAGVAAPTVPTAILTEIEQKAAELTPVGDALVESKPDTGADESKRAFVSKGEKIHKWGTYLTVDWIFNAITGVSFAYWGAHTESGKKLWSGPLNKIFNKALKPLIKDPELLEKSVGKGNMFMSVIAGGMFTIPPLMALENNETKASITQYLDEKIYGKEAVANDPKFQEAYEEIKTAPKKDFASGMWSRFAALTPLLAMVLIPSTRKVSDKVYFNHVARASETVANTIGFSEKSFKNLAPAIAKERWKFIHESVAMDFGLGIPYAMLHSFFYDKFVSHKNNDKPEEAAPARLETALITVPETTVSETKWVEKTQTALAQPLVKPFTSFADKAADKSTLEPQRA